MENLNEDRLVKCIEKILVENPKDSSYGNQFYWKNWLLKQCAQKDISNEVINESVNVYYSKDIFQKPMVYLLAICTNKQNDINRKKLKELRQLGTIPPIVDANT